MFLMRDNNEKQFFNYINAQCKTFIFSSVISFKLFLDHQIQYLVLTYHVFFILKKSFLSLSRLFLVNPQKKHPKPFHFDSKQSSSIQNNQYLCESLFTKIK